MPAVAARASGVPITAVVGGDVSLGAAGHAVIGGVGTPVVAGTDIGDITGIAGAVASIAGCDGGAASASF